MYYFSIVDGEPHLRVAAALIRVMRCERSLFFHSSGYLPTQRLCLFECIAVWRSEPFIEILLTGFSFVAIAYPRVRVFPGEEKRLRLRGRAREAGLHHLHRRNREPPPPLVRAWLRYRCLFLFLPVVCLGDATAVAHVIVLVCVPQCLSSSSSTTLDHLTPLCLDMFIAHVALLVWFLSAGTFAPRH